MTIQELKYAQLERVCQSDYYYHSSDKLITGALQPSSSRVLKGDSAVFATNLKAVALSFCARWRDEDMAQGTVNGELYMAENKPGAFDRIFKNKNGYLYLVPKSMFVSQQGLTRYEFISSIAVPILKTYSVTNILGYLLKEKVTLISYEEAVKNRITTESSILNTW